jgi:hypothetical protein
MIVGKRLSMEGLCLLDFVAITSNKTNPKCLNIEGFYEVKDSR